jgi:hypothetical protein
VSPSLCTAPSCLPDDLITPKTRPLQASVDALCRIAPEGAVSLRERFDLSPSQLDSLIAQLVQGSVRIVQESEAILLIGDQPTDNQLNRFLRPGCDISLDCIAAPCRIGTDPARGRRCISKASPHGVDNNSDFLQQ